MKDYLLAIYNIEEQNKVARISGIAHLLGVTSSSVNGMVKVLAKRKLVVYEKYGFVNLTEEGRHTASQLKSKNAIIKKFFVKYLGIEEQTADRDAQKIRNILSDDSFNKLKHFIYFLENRADHRDINCAKEVEIFNKHSKQQMASKT
jgi:DtxR family Mn-dependent transcriptional regulator